MITLGIDVGSSSVKAGVLVDGALQEPLVRESFPTDYHADRVEVDANAVLSAVVNAIARLPRANDADVVALSVMAPSWVAMDRMGTPLTPIITHQDRRSVQIARDLETRVGFERHLEIAGNRPFPGGISSTTAAWFNAHEPRLMSRVDLVGHLNTLLIRLMTGDRVTDPSNASFTGLYETCTLAGWSDELCAAAGVSKNVLPRVLDSEQIAGRVHAEGARRFGLKLGLPVMAGCMDTSAALLLVGATPGQTLNVVGSTDVLAVCVSEPKPHERLLTRAVGMGKRWMSVSTVAAAGSSLSWAKDEFFRDLPIEQYHELLAELTAKPNVEVTFENYLAGERTSIDQRRGRINGLTLGSTRNDILRALIETLAVESAKRLELLSKVNSAQPLSIDVLLTGGVQDGLSAIMHRDWPKKYRFFSEREATLQGLAKLAERRRGDLVA